MDAPPDDATRRTWLANERTWLAWVRTGFTATAVALGVGKIAPEVADEPNRWPYVAIGGGYALLGALLVAYGFTRRNEVRAAIRRGGYADPEHWAVVVFATVGVILGLATFALLVFG